MIVSTSAAATRAAAADGSRSLLDLWRMRRAVAAWGDKLDVFYFPADYTYFPVSKPPASGLHGMMPTPHSRAASKCSCSMPRSTREY